MLCGGGRYKKRGEALYRKGKGQSLGGGLIAEVAPEENFRALLTAVVNGKFRPCHRFMPDRKSTRLNSSHL